MSRGQGDFWNSINQGLCIGVWIHIMSGLLKDAACVWVAARFAETDMYLCQFHGSKKEQI
ncbi:hypothetical protein BS78_01G048500 [Paspalum vaginatum]|nr:hypothetical protein BS78_01G048500 [Paspalum vaginatum]